MRIQFTDNSKQYKDEMEDRIKKILETIGIDIEREAKMEIRGDYGSPERIDTGLLRNSVTHATSGNPTVSQSYSPNDGTITGSYSGITPKKRPDAISCFA